jgi:DNA-binding helix-hairpin-helix protein with protein kinase domain
VNEEGAPFDSGFDDAGPFSDTPEGDGVPLDAALREFGPAAFEDLVPRLRALAADLDAAHDAGFIHGRLHPSKVLVTGDATYLVGARVSQSIDSSLVAGDSSRWPVLPPYTAPEVVGGTAPAPTADQFALAAIAYEWMFGRPLSGPAARPLEVRAIPNVDRAALSKAFTRALALHPVAILLTPLPHHWCRHCR